MAPKRDARYEETRRNFEELDVEEQASFLVEATASTVARGVLQVGEMLADGLEDILRRSRPRAEPSSEGPGPAEPETAQSRKPQSGE